MTTKSILMSSGKILLLAVSGFIFAACINAANAQELALIMMGAI